MDFETTKLVLPRKPNFEMDMGEDTGAVRWCMIVKKTWVNRLKWWLFFRFFPFKLVRWEKETKQEAQP